MAQQPGLPVSTWSFPAPSGGKTDTADSAAAAAPGVGRRNVVTGIQLTNAHATVSTEVVIKSGSTVIWRYFARAVDVNPISVVFDPPLKGADNAAINVANITTGSQTYPSLQGEVRLTE